MKVTYRFYIVNTALLVVINLFSQAVNAEQLYKWVDKKGNVTYQSSPPPEGARSVEKSSLNSGAVEEVEEDAAETLPITYYTKPECSACDDARAYFEENEIPTTEVDILENTAEAEKMEKQLGHNDVPTILVGNKSIMGFQKKMMDRILKNAGYDIPGEEGAEDITEGNVEEAGEKEQ